MRGVTFFVEVLMNPISLFFFLLHFLNEYFSFFGRRPTACTHIFCISPNFAYNFFIQNIFYRLLYGVVQFFMTKGPFCAATVLV